MKVSLKEIFKNYGSTEVIKGLDLEINSGELISLLGPSGCGKTTTLFMLSGLESVTSGNIYFGDRDVTKLTASQRNIGLVFQNYALYPHFTVLQNVMYPILNKKINKVEAKEMAMRVIKAVSLEDQIDKKPGQLSGGQQQRVAIARAIAKQPEILLLDEPISNLDAKLKESTIKEIKAIQREFNITTVFVTHDQQEALAVSDRVVILDKGVIQQIGTPNELHNNPANLYVAKFVGTPTINTLEVEVKDKKLVGLEGLVNSDLDVADGKYILGIRPSHLKLSDKGIDVENIDNEILGRDILYHCVLNDMEIKVILQNEVDLIVPRNIKLEVSIANVLLFDTETNNRVL